MHVATLSLQTGVEVKQQWFDNFLPADVKIYIYGAVKGNGDAMFTALAVRTDDSNVKNNYRT